MNPPEIERLLAALDRAAASVESFRREVDVAEGARGANNRGSRLDGAGIVGGLAAGGAFAGAARGFAVGQATDLDGGVQASLYGALGALGKVPGLGNITGATGAANVLDRAGGSVAGITGDLAKYGINVSDEFRNGLVNTSVEQQRREENENLAVAAALGDPAAIGRAGGQADGPNVPKLIGAFETEFREGLQALKDILAFLSRIGGGAS